MAASTAVRYEGQRFRSELEARWAIVLDVLGVSWRHGTTVDLGDLGRRRPSFWLPKELIWIVATAERDDLTYQRCFRLAEHPRRSVVLVQGLPGYQVIEEIDAEPTFQVHIFHGWKLPNPTVFPEASEDFYTIFYKEDGLQAHLTRKGYNVPSCDGSRESILQLVNLDRDYWQRTNGGDHPRWRYGFCETQSMLRLSDGGDLTFGMRERGTDTLLTRAIDAALAAELEPDENA